MNQKPFWFIQGPATRYQFPTISFSNHRSSNTKMSGDSSQGAGGGENNMDQRQPDRKKRRLGAVGAENDDVEDLPFDSSWNEPNDSIPDVNFLSDVDINNLFKDYNPALAKKIMEQQFAKMKKQHFPVYMTRDPTVICDRTRVPRRTSRASFTNTKADEPSTDESNLNSQSPAQPIPSDEEVPETSSSNSDANDKVEDLDLDDGNEENMEPVEESPPVTTENSNAAQDLDDDDEDMETTPPPIPQHNVFVPSRDPDVYTIPSLEDLNDSQNMNQCWVSHFLIGHRKYGSITFCNLRDVYGIDVDKLVRFEDKLIMTALSGPHLITGDVEITLRELWPVDPNTKQDVKDRGSVSRFENDLQADCKRNGWKFITYENGSFTYKVTFPQTCN